MKKVKTTADKIRAAVQKKLHEQGITAGEFYRRHAKELGITVKQRSFEHFATSSKAQVGPLKMAFEYLYPDREIIKEGVPAHGITFYIRKREVANAKPKK